MKWLFLLIAVCTFTVSRAQQYSPDKAASKVAFTVKNLGIGVDGVFNDIEGDIVFDPAALGNAKFNVQVQTNTINTDNKKRDEHLRSESFLNVAQFLTMQFVSSSITTTPTGYTMNGQLTIRGVTKSISFPFTATHENDGWLFKSEFTINRRDFNVGGSSMTMSDNVKVQLSVVAKKK